MSELLRCIDCGHLWDDDDPEQEICDCFERLASARRRCSSRSEAVTWSRQASGRGARAGATSLHRLGRRKSLRVIHVTYGLDGRVNGATNTWATTTPISKGH